MNKYESPKVQFKEIRLSSAIAERCWSWANHSGDDSCYYNTKGSGYVRFKVDGDNCKEKLGLKVEIIGYENVTDKVAADEDFNNWWLTKVPNGDSSFKGAGYSENPDPSWS